MTASAQMHVFHGKGVRRAAPLLPPSIANGDCLPAFALLYSHQKAGGRAMLLVADAFHDLLTMNTTMKDPCLHQAEPARQALQILADVGILIILILILILILIILIIIIILIILILIAILLLVLIIILLIILILILILTIILVILILIAILLLLLLIIIILIILIIEVVVVNDITVLLPSTVALARRCLDPNGFSSGFQRHRTVPPLTHANRPSSNASSRVSKSSAASSAL